MDWKSMAVEQGSAGPAARPNLKADEPSADPKADQPNAGLKIDVRFFLPRAIPAMLNMQVMKANGGRTGERLAPQQGRTLSQTLLAPTQRRINRTRG